DDDPDPVRIVRADNNTGVGDRLPGGGDGELGEAGRAPQPLTVENLRGVEAAHLGGDPHRRSTRVERRDRPDAGVPGDEVPPDRLAVVTNPGNGAQSGDHDAAATTMCHVDVPLGNPARFAYGSCSLRLAWCSTVPRGPAERGVAAAARLVHRPVHGRL